MFNNIKYLEVPQGSLLGITVFRLYINGLLSVKCNAEVTGFADDMAIFVEENTWYNLKIKAEGYFR